MTSRSVGEQASRLNIAVNSRFCKPYNFRNSKYPTSILTNRPQTVKNPEKNIIMKLEVGSRIRAGTNTKEIGII
jgi:hypothetical protein